LRKSQAFGRAITGMRSQGNYVVLRGDGLLIVGGEKQNSTAATEPRNGFGVNVAVRTTDGHRPPLPD
jgi:hypothetical protein